MKRRLVPLLAIALVLSACGRAPEAAPTAPPPAAPASQTPEAPPSPTPEPEPPWWEGITVDDLPDTPATAEEVLAGGQDFCLLARLPGEDIALYGSSAPAPGGRAGVLLRRGDTLTPFDQVYLPDEAPALPQLWWDDFDGDGGAELAVKYLIRNHAGSHVYELHIYEPEGEGWIDHGLTDRDADALLSELVTCRYDAAGHTVTASVPGGSASYPLGEGGPEPQAGGTLTFVDRTFYRYEDGSFTGVYGVGALLQGLDDPRYFASVTADVVYDGAGFSLENLQLMEIGGV